MKAEIILTDNNINIDLNEPTIDVSTEDGFSVTIIGGVGPQGNRGPEGPKGEKGDDYVLTEEDKDSIAGMAAEKVDLTDYVKKNDYATTFTAGVIKVGGLGVKMSDGELVLAPASSRQIKQGIGDTAPVIAAKEHEAVFYGLAKAAGDESQRASENTVGAYTDAAKTAIRIMLGIDLTELVRNTDYATNTAPGVVKLLNNYGIYNNAGYAVIYKAPLGEIKAGLSSFKPIVPSNQHESVFYGLAKAAGDDMSESDYPVGTYTDAAKAAIRSMVDAIGPEDYAGVNRAGVVKIINNYGLALLNGVITTFPASAETIKAASNNTYGSYHPITPIRQHHAVFYGLAKAAGDETQQESDNEVGVYTDQAKTAIRTMLGVPSPEDIPSVPVEDVQVNGISVVNDGIATVPIASPGVFGLVKPTSTYGVNIIGSNFIGLVAATDAQIKAGAAIYATTLPNSQHKAAFYGLAKAAGDTTQSQSSNAVGTYTAEAKTAIRAMLDVPGMEDIPTVPVQDVQVAGSSVLTNGIANIPFATQNTFGVTAIGDGLQRSSANKVMICAATASQVKAGLSAYYPICPNQEHSAAFYGLAKAAGDTTQSSSNNGVGIYTDEAKAAIKAMLGIEDGLKVVRLL